MKPYIGESWLDTPWLYSEFYAYRRVVEAFSFFKTGKPLPGGVVGGEGIEGSFASLDPVATAGVGLIKNEIPVVIPTLGQVWRIIQILRRYFSILYEASVDIRNSFFVSLLNQGASDDKAILSFRSSV